MENKELKPATPEEIADIIRDSMRNSIDAMARGREDKMRLNLIFPEAVVKAFFDLNEEPPLEFQPNTAGFIYYFEFAAQAFLFTASNDDGELLDGTEDDIAQSLLVFEETNRGRLLLDANRMFLMEHSRGF